MKNSKEDEVVNMNDYIKEAAKKKGWHKYYLTMRPIGIGAQPSGMMDFINYDKRTEVNGRMVWAEVYYDRELTEKELEDYEMIRG